MTNDELIKKAAALIKARNVGGFTVGDVGCVLITDRGNLYSGVCIDTGSGMGFCAEHNAVGSMITSGESRIERIVGVWKDAQASVFVLAPCGRCREFIYRTNKENLDTDVILGSEASVLTLSRLFQLNLLRPRIELGDAEAANLAGLGSLGFRRFASCAAFPSRLQHGAE